MVRCYLHLSDGLLVFLIFSLFVWFQDGKLKQFFKSEPIPEVNNEPVKVVVRDTLRDLVLNSGKNVLLEFYAPWCGHCKALAPILDEVALSFEKDSDVLIAKLVSNYGVVKYR